MDIPRRMRHCTRKVPLPAPLRRGGRFLFLVHRQNVDHSPCKENSVLSAEQGIEIEEREIRPYWEPPILDYRTFEEGGAFFELSRLLDKATERLPSWDPNSFLMEDDVVEGQLLLMYASHVSSCKEEARRSGSKHVTDFYEHLSKDIDVELSDNNRSALEHTIENGGYRRVRGGAEEGSVEEAKLEELSGKLLDYWIAFTEVSEKADKGELQWTYESVTEMYQQIRGFYDDWLAVGAEIAKSGSLGDEDDIVQAMIRLRGGVIQELVEAFEDLAVVKRKHDEMEYENSSDWIDTESSTDSSDTEDSDEEYYSAASQCSDSSTELQLKTTLAPQTQAEDSEENHSSVSQCSNEVTQLPALIATIPPEQPVQESILAKTITLILNLRWAFI